MSYKNDYKFKNRYQITGTLTVETSLHIGSGNATTHPDLKNEEDKLVEISAINRDFNDKPYIPASTLKGNLRAWMETHVQDKSLLKKLFGGEPNEKNADGGKIRFSNSYIDKELPESNFPYWKQECQTGIQVGVTIDRQRKTARDEKLFYWEVVPTGVTFKIQITGQDLEDYELAILLVALYTDDPKKLLTLGSETAQGQGKMSFRNLEVKNFDGQQVIDWLTKENNKQEKMWFDNLQTIETAKFIKKGQELITESNHPILRITLQLQFDSPFLVNDPSQVKKDKQNNDPDFYPRIDANGKAYLPAKSFRGAIRSQAERIIRTLNGHVCYIDESKPECKPVFKRDDVKKLCLACQLFGGTGWKTPINISDFRLAEPDKNLVISINQDKKTKIKKKPKPPYLQSEFYQDFVAIDRFTGGGCNHAKFKAKTIYAPVLEGTCEIDLLRIDPWGLGLLVLLMRDLIEGDITFGYGAAKGYGHCEAKLQNWTIDKLPPEDEVWKYWIERANKLDLEEPQQWQDGKRYLVNELVQAFRDKIKTL